MAKPFSAHTSALTLASAQQSDRIRADTESDEAIGDTGEQKSVLDLGRERPSYVFREPLPEPPMAGGGLLESPMSQLQGQRAATEDMSRAQEQFIGGQPDIERAEAYPTEPLSTRTVITTTSAETDAAARAQALAIQQAQAAEQARQQARLAQAEAQQTQTQNQAANQQQMKQMRQFIEGAELSNAVDSGGLTLITYAGRANLRLANKLLFKNDFLSTVSLSDPSEPLQFEDVVKVGTINSTLMLAWMLLPPMVFIVAIVIFILLLGSQFGAIKLTDVL